MSIKTPYYLIDESKLLDNLKIIDYIRKASKAKFLLATKCFSTWSVFDFIKSHMDGTTSSSLNEVRLGYEKFGKETHAYSVAYSPDEIDEIKKYSNKIIFNSVSQLNRYYKDVKGKNIGIRINPSLGFSHFDLANPSRKNSRLGVIDRDSLMEVLPKIKGCMFHFNCENDDIINLARNIDNISKIYGPIIKKLKWVSLGGGVFFTKKGYPVEELCVLLKQFSNQFGVQVYMEPGDAVVTNTTELVTTVLDIVHNEKDIAIVDASVEAHMLDLLTYRLKTSVGSAKKHSKENPHSYIIAGRSCLAGDIFGSGSFPTQLKVGDTVRLLNAGGYTMVKKNWFNGVRMPSIAIKRLDGTVELIKSFDYSDFLGSLS